MRYGSGVLKAIDVTLQFSAFSLSYCCRIYCLNAELHRKIHRIIIFWGEELKLRFLTTNSIFCSSFRAIFVRHLSGECNNTQRPMPNHSVKRCQNELRTTKEVRENIPKHTFSLHNCIIALLNSLFKIPKATTVQGVTLKTFN